jgi:hypothetical protein
MAASPLIIFEPATTTLPLLLILATMPAAPTSATSVSHLSFDYFEKGSTCPSSPEFGGESTLCGIWFEHITALHRIAITCSKLPQIPQILLDLEEVRLKLANPSRSRSGDRPQLTEKGLHSFFLIRMHSLCGLISNTSPQTIQVDRIRGICDATSSPLCFWGFLNQLDIRIISRALLRFGPLQAMWFPCSTN